MIVMKFGGGSAADAGRVLSMADIVRQYMPRRPVVVLSAMGNTTDYLLAATDSALKTRIVSIRKIEEVHLKAIEELGLGVEITSLIGELKNLLLGISMVKDYLVSFGERLSVRIASVYFRKTGVNAKPVDARR